MLISGNTNNNHLISVIKNRNTRISVTNVTYGNIDMLLNKPYLQSLGDNELLHYNQIDKLSFSGKVPKNKRRAKSIFKLEDDIISVYDRYVLVRLDITSQLKLNKLSRDDFLLFLQETKNNILHNSFTLELLSGWCYVIERGGRGGNHLHWYIFIDGNRYTGQWYHDRMNRYLKDMDRLKSTIIQYLDNRRRLELPIGIVDINISTLSKDDGIGLCIIEKDDVSLRNCARAWLCYICKDNTHGVGKSYGKTQFSRIEMKTDVLYDWISSLDRLVSYDDIKLMNKLRYGVVHHSPRIESFFKMEDDISNHYTEYLLIPFKLHGHKDIIKPDEVAKFAKRYTTYRLSNVSISPYDIGYCWCINEIGDISEYYFNVYCSITGDYIDIKIVKIIDTIRKWFYYTITKLTPSHIEVPSLSKDDITNTLDYNSRNKTRYQLTTMMMTNNEDEDMRPKNVRSFAMSRIKLPSDSLPPL